MDKRNQDRTIQKQQNSYDYDGNNIRSNNRGDSGSLLQLDGRSLRIVRYLEKQKNENDKT